MITKFVTRTVVYVEHPDDVRVTYRALRERMQELLTTDLACWPDALDKESGKFVFLINRARVDEVDQK